MIVFRMHRFWQTVIGPALEAARSKSIVEIGMGKGHTTRRLIRYCLKTGAVLQSVDPSPACDIEALRSIGAGIFTYFKDPSLSVLPILQAYDAVLIDGDHNWYTVYHELQSINERAARGAFPLVFVRHTSWPYARRDRYEDPEMIPDHARQAYRKGGLKRGNSVVHKGAGLHSDSFHAVYEHNPRNGVLTAVEDFIKQADAGLQTFSLGGFCGLTVIVHTSLLAAAPQLQKLLQDAATNRLLSLHIENLEAVRIDHLVEHSDTPLLREQLQRSAEAQRRLEEEMHAMHERLDESEKKALSLKGALAHERHALEQESASFKAMQQQLVLAVITAEEALQHQRRTLSWRITAPLRVSHGWLRALRRPRMPRNILRPLRKIWVALGEPFPGFARFLRHRVLVNVLPSRFDAAIPPPPPQPAPQENSVVPAPSSAPPAGNTDPSEGQNTSPVPVEAPVLHSHSIASNAPTANSLHIITAPKVAVIIHVRRDTVPFLAEAIESALAQVVTPAEILVVDVTSQEHALLIVERYKNRGVSILQGDWRERAAALNAGIEATTAPLIQFLDAKDILHIDTLQITLDALRSHPDASILYSDQQLFGSQQLRIVTPWSFRWDTFDLIRYDPCSAMFRRTALLKAGGWNEQGEDHLWEMWRNIFKQGGVAVRCHGMTFIRTSQNLFSHTITLKTSFAQKEGYFEEPATLCLSLSGRKWAWQITRIFLEKQTFPHNLVHLVILDTSQDEEYGATVKEWLAGSDYGKTTYLAEAVGSKGLADEPRELVRDEVRAACARIYDRFRDFASTKLVFFLEDDIQPPPDVYRRLIAKFEPDVMSVSAACRHSNGIWGDDHPFIAWNWDRDGQAVFANRQETCAPIGGNGFSCVVVRGEYLRKTPFTDGPPLSGFDQNFYRCMRDDGFKALLDWGCDAQHFVNEYTWI